MVTYVSQKAYNRMTAQERELHDLREAAERRDARLNEPMTRGAIIEAIENAAILTEHDGQREILDLLKKVFE